MVLFEPAHGWGGGKKAHFSKIFHTCATIMKLETVVPYLKKIQKQKWESRVIYPFSSADISIFSTKISKFCYIKKNRYRFYFDRWFLILLTFFESLKIFLINMVTILVMSAKIATLGLLKINVFSNNGYDIIVSVDNANKNIAWLKFYCKCGRVTKIW